MQRHQKIEIKSFVILVKFAKYEPGENELRELHSSALRLVEETEPVKVQNPEAKVQS